MAIVSLLDDDEYSQEIHDLDDWIREYTQAPGMTPYVKSAAHYPPLLELLAKAHLEVMPTDELTREVKELIAVAVSMVNACGYCIRAHSKLQKQLFDRTDQELVELAAAVAHVNGLNRFETATLNTAYEHPLFEPRSPDDVPMLADIEDELGVLPEYYRVIANDPDFLAVVWERERVVMLEGDLDPVWKRYVAFAVSVVNDAPYSVRLNKQLLSDEGETDAAIFEALEVIDVFQENNARTTGLMLGAGLWGEE